MHHVNYFFKVPEGKTDIQHLRRKLIAQWLGVLCECSRQLGLVKEGRPHHPTPLGWSASQLLAGEISGQKGEEIDLLLPILALKIESIFPTYIGKFQC